MEDRIRNEEEEKKADQQPTGNRKKALTHMHAAAVKERRNDGRKEIKIENESNDLPPLGVIIQGSDDDNDLIQFRKCIRSSLFVHSQHYETASQHVYTLVLGLWRCRIIFCWSFSGWFFVRCCSSSFRLFVNVA